MIPELFPGTAAVSAASAAVPAAPIDRAPAADAAGDAFASLLDAVLPPAGGESAQRRGFAADAALGSFADTVSSEAAPQPSEEKLEDTTALLALMPVVIQVPLTIDNVTLGVAVAAGPADTEAPDDEIDAAFREADVEVSTADVDRRPQRGDTAVVTAPGQVPGVPRALAVPGFGSTPGTVGTPGTPDTLRGESSDSASATREAAFAWRPEPAGTRASAPDVPVAVAAASAVETGAHGAEASHAEGLTPAPAVAPVAAPESVPVAPGPSRHAAAPATLEHQPANGSASHALHAPTPETRTVARAAALARALDGRDPQIGQPSAARPTDAQTAVGQMHAQALLQAQAPGVPGRRSDATAPREEQRQPLAAALRDMAARAERVAAADRPSADAGSPRSGDADQPGYPSGGSATGWEPRAAPLPDSAAASRIPMPQVVAPVALASPGVDVVTAPLVRGAEAGQPFTAAQEAENAARLVESVRLHSRQGVSEATVKLNPAHFGELTISIRVERGQVAAVVHAETAAVQQWLEAQEEKVRSGLAEQGLILERFVVQRDAQQQRREARQQQPAPRYRVPAETGQRFEITV